MKKTLLFYSLFVFSLPAWSMAQTVPGSADPARINPPQKQPFETQKPVKIESRGEASFNIPEGVEGVRFQLKSVSIEGVSAFDASDLEDIYAPYLERDVSLDVLWVMAAQITERYRNKGYFLSRAYVPAQEIEDGNVMIRVVEGYAADVDFADEEPQYRIIQQLVSRIQQARPLSAEELESFMLHMNALPGKQFRAVVEPLDTAETGAVRLKLITSQEDYDAYASFDNNGSRFLGPYQTTAIYSDSFIPLHETTLMALTSLPTDEINFLSLRHEVPVYPDWNMFVTSSHVRSSPGASLDAFDIDSQSTTIGLGAKWQPIRQWQENLTFRFEITGRNTNVDIFDNDPQTRDRIRTVRVQADYDTSDTLDGYNYLSFSVNQGLDLLGASDAGAANLSRAEAEPDFTFAEIDYTRQQALPHSLLAVGRIAAQIASGPLYSAEEFGLGGQNFGRAYDPSEILGDHGLAGSLELRYQGFEPWQGVRYAPFVFYDVGKVWNDDIGTDSESLASAGFGVRGRHESGISGQLGLAWPLTRSIEKPIYGGGHSPRILLQFGYEF